MEVCGSGSKGGLVEGLVEGGETNRLLSCFSKVKIQVFNIFNTKILQFSRRMILGAFA